MAKGVKPGIKKKGLGGNKDGLQGVKGGAGTSYGRSTAGSGRATTGKSNVTPKTMNLMKKSGAISSGPTIAQARTAANKELTRLQNAFINAPKGSSEYTARKAQLDKQISQLQKLIKKWS